MTFTLNPFASLVQRVDARRILEKQLSDAMSSKVEHAANREYHAAMERMLETRIGRVRNELEKLA